MYQCLKHMFLLITSCNVTLISSTQFLYNNKKIIPITSKISIQFLFHALMSIFIVFPRILNQRRRANTTDYKANSCVTIALWVETSQYKQFNHVQVKNKLSVLLIYTRSQLVHRNYLDERRICVTDSWSKNFLQKYFVTVTSGRFSTSQLIFQ